MAKASPATKDEYQVVALRYRPDTFEKLVGQDHIATALSNAIKLNRVGHAYLFTGARGVGKTSSARIFAKCLNCEKGPTDQPCNQCDICQAVSSGEDVDVLEIDGASNRGIDEIRQLRSNAAVRPSRAKFKIYIIDEVHMLTMQAFNALLKTLEEPPSHVKFIFCTTDPQKIPITVLSRCQRFDFSPVQTDQIAGRLREIAESEGVKADDEALALLARRANGSMRDSQSLLEQLFSFCGKEISVNEVHQLFGTADTGRIAEVASAMSAGDAAATLNLINQDMLRGIDAGQMAEQLLGYFRDMMAVRVGCGEDVLLNSTSSDVAGLNSLADQLGLESILMIVQLLDAAIVRMQSSLHARTLLEATSIRICNVEKLESVSELIEALGKSDSSTSPRPKPAQRPSRSKTPMTKVQTGKKKEVELEETTSVSAPVTNSTTGLVTAESSVEINSTGVASSEKASASQPKPNPTTLTEGPLLNVANLDKTWKQVVSLIDDMTSDMARAYQKLELKSPDHLVVTLENKVSKDLCSKPDKKQKFENLLHQVTGADVRLDFLAGAVSTSVASAPKLSRVQQIRKLHENDFVKQAISLFDAEITGYREPAKPKKS